MKGRSIAEVVVVFALFQVILIIPQGIRSLVRWENTFLGGSYFTGVLMVALAVFMIILNRYEYHQLIGGVALGMGLEDPFFLFYLSLQSLSSWLGELITRNSWQPQWF